MYVAHTGADRVDVLDCKRRSFLRSSRSARSGRRPDRRARRPLVHERPSRRAGERLRCSDEQLLGQVSAGPHPNGLAYDANRRRLYAFNLGEPLGENCTASIVEVDSLQVIAEFPLPGRPRWAVYDPERDVVFANIREPAQIIVIDCSRPRSSKCSPCLPPAHTGSGSTAVASSAQPTAACCGPRP